MSLNEQSRKLNSTVSTESATDELVARLSKSAVQHRSYHELGDHHVVERDGLEQLSHNVKQLEDLQQRFSFMMREIAGLLKL